MRNVSATLDELTQRLQARRDLPPPEMRRLLRKAAGASQQDVARVLDVTRQSISLWEHGTRTPRGANLDAYLEVLRAFTQSFAKATNDDGAGSKEVNPRADAAP